MASNEPRTASPEQVERAQELWGGFTKAATICTAVIIAILVLMAAFLL
ncbi:MAG: aa3-type cytochrome c oxidase subunit IV [Alphaproteobacteria bacterium]|nr:aa3-type cytochrome c oxidase subunit IV [Alphaproteobacteria bacterium SS10]